MLGKVKGRQITHNRNPRGVEFSEKENITYFTKGCLEVIPDKPELIPKSNDLYEVLCTNKSKNNNREEMKAQLIGLIIALADQAKTRKLWKVFT